MPATLARKCTDTALGLFHVESYTEANKSYNVTLEADGRDTCSCMAFVMTRGKAMKRHRERTGFDLEDPLALPEVTCKHIQGLRATRNGCGWTSDSKEQHEYEAICPKCFADTEVYDQRDPETVDLDELMADFLALKKKLKQARA